MSVSKWAYEPNKCDGDYCIGDCDLCPKRYITDCSWADDTELEQPDAPDQTAKADAGKPMLTLVPQKIMYAIARVREYGVRKYKDPDNWKKVDRKRYRDAAFRHFLAYLRDPKGKDKESGLPHLWHVACNIAFLIEMEFKEYEYD